MYWRHVPQAALASLGSHAARGVTEGDGVLATASLLESERLDTAWFERHYRVHYIAALREQGHGQQILLTVSVKVVGSFLMQQDSTASILG